jgi:hypothetical protein
MRSSSKTLTVIISLAHVIKDLWTAVNSVVSMIEVTTMFVVVWAEIPDVIENKKVYSQVTTEQDKKIDESIIPKKQQIKLTT